jgi:hypothetical protein
MNETQSIEGIYLAGIAATYREAELQEYRGNPLIEALSPIDSEIQVQDPLKYYHIVNFVIRIKPSKYIRSHSMVNTAVFFTPLPIQLSLQQQVDRMLRSDYISRNLMATGYWRRLNLELLIIDNE